MYLDRREPPSLPSRGIYTLVVNIPQDIALRVGSLGLTKISPGIYVYVGSAIGSRGEPLRRRVFRHLSREKRIKWHIDYLLTLNNVHVVAVIAAHTELKLECNLVRELISRGFKPAIRGFGSSDCKCTSHFLRLDGLELTLSSVEESFRHLGLTPVKLALWSEAHDN